MRSGCLSSRQQALKAHCSPFECVNLSQATDVVQALMKLLRSGTYVRSFKTTCSPVQALGKGLSYQQPELQGHPSTQLSQDKRKACFEDTEHIVIFCCVNGVVGRTAPLPQHVNQSSDLEYTNPLQKSLMWVPGASYSEKDTAQEKKKKGKQNSPSL